MILFGFNFSFDDIFVGLTRFHFYKAAHIPLHIVETSLQAKSLAHIRRFQYGIFLIQMNIPEQGKYQSPPLLYARNEFCSR